MTYMCLFMCVCRDCLGARDPYCGWDRKQKRCSTIEDSSNMSQWSQNITKCPVSDKVMKRFQTRSHSYPGQHWEQKIPIAKCGKELNLLMNERKTASDVWSVWIEVSIWQCQLHADVLPDGRSMSLLFSNDTSSHPSLYITNFLLSLIVDIPEGTIIINKHSRYTLVD